MVLVLRFFAGFGFGFGFGAVGFGFEVAGFGFEFSKPKPATKFTRSVLLNLLFKFESMSLSMYFNLDIVYTCTVYCITVFSRHILFIIERIHVIMCVPSSSAPVEKV